MHDLRRCAKFLEFKLNICNSLRCFGRTISLCMHYWHWLSLQRSIWRFDQEMLQRILKHYETSYKVDDHDDDERFGRRTTEVVCELFGNGVLYP
mmetsp:Transcript_12084/g.17718  ORF Transcript_12084/g.17718 Transcript_12084/m.17718 type:complete len:94 (-) Transcript_12084:71-352(-)